MIAGGVELFRAMLPPEATLTLPVSRSVQRVIGHGEVRSSQAEDRKVARACGTKSGRDIPRACRRRGEQLQGSDRALGTQMSGHHKLL
jgi:hypothetical protein